MSNTDNDGRCRGCGAFFAHADDCPGETPTGALDRITPGGNPVCPKCGRGFGETYGMPDKLTWPPMWPLYVAIAVLIAVAVWKLT